MPDLWRLIGRSPNARWVARRPAPQGPASFDRYSGIVVERATGGERQRIVRHLVVSGGLRWSPDSRRLLFVGASRSGRGGVFVATRDGHTVRRLTRRGRFTEARFSPLGDRVLAVRHGRPATLVTIPVEGGSTSTVAVIRRGGAAGLDWAPNGRKIAYGVTVTIPPDPKDRDPVTGIRETINVVTSAGRGRRSLGDGRFPTYSPDGRFIVFEGQCVASDTTPGVCIMRSDGSGRRFAARWDEQGAFRPEVGGLMTQAGAPWLRAGR